MNSVLRKLPSASVKVLRRDLVAALMRDPEYVLRHLRRAASSLSSDIPRTLPPEDAERQLTKLHRIAPDLQSAVFLRFSESVNVNWHAGRFLDRVGRTQDSLLHFEFAVQAKPPNAKLYARCAQAMLRLHEDEAFSGHDKKALAFAEQAHALEASEYTAQLLQLAEDTVFDTFKLQHGTLHVVASR